MYMGVLPVHICLCTTWVQPGTCGGQERMVGPFVLEFQMVLSHHVGAENPAPQSTKNPGSSSWCS